MKKEESKKGLVRISSGLPVYNEKAAGIDIGDTLHYIAISDGAGGHEVKTTSAFTSDLREIVSYLQLHGITTAAMESTGVYWLPLYILLEESGIEPYLVNAAHVKNVTGRKKDDTDAIWLQKLHTCGLLQKSFQPDSETRVLRTYTRQRKNLINLGADCVRRMQKALELMNIKIHTVISDILGKTGMLIVKSIIAGERDPQTLSELCDSRIKASREEIIKSLTGFWQEDYLFMLEQAVENYEFHQKQIKSCELKIEAQLLKQVSIIKEGDLTSLDKSLAQDTDSSPLQISENEPRKIKPQITKKKIHKAKKNQFDTPISAYLKEIAGVDLTKIPGISEVSALEIISEVGVDMSKWKSAKHFAAWLNLAPNTKITGGKIISSKMRKKDNKAGQCLRQAASCLSTNKSAIGDYHRTIRSKLGGKGAALATAHKLSRIIYTMLLNKTEYNEEMISNNQKNGKEQKIKKLEKLLERLKKAA